MMDLEKFKRKVIGRFCEQLTDQVFLMIQNDRELMNDYLHVLCQHKHVHDVNGKIAKAVKESFGLENLSKRNKKPRSFLIQSFEQFKTAKTLLTILMLCGVICGYAQKNPPHAASTMTWVIKSYGVTQTWSDNINLPACNKTEYNAGPVHDTPKADCRNGLYENSDYLYSWSYVKQHANKLCPPPWRMPTMDDFAIVDAYPYLWTKPNTVICGNNGGITNMISAVGLWSITSTSKETAGCLSHAMGHDDSDLLNIVKHAGLGVRCVR